MTIITEPVTEPMNAIEFIYNVFINITRTNGDINGIACMAWLMVIGMIIIAITERGTNK